MSNGTGDEGPRNTTSPLGSSPASVDVEVSPDRSDLVARWRWRPLVFAAAAFVALTFAGISVLRSHPDPGTNATLAASQTLPVELTTVPDGNASATTFSSVPMTSTAQSTAGVAPSADSVPQQLKLCSASMLRSDVFGGDSLSGHVKFEVSLVNVSDVDCTLDGHPVVSIVLDDGTTEALEADPSTYFGDPLPLAGPLGVGEAGSFYLVGNWTCDRAPEGVTFKNRTFMLTLPDGSGLQFDAAFDPACGTATSSYGSSDHLREKGQPPTDTDRGSTTAETNT